MSNDELHRRPEIDIYMGGNFQTVSHLNKLNEQNE